MLVMTEIRIEKIHYAKEKENEKMAVTIDENSIAP